MLILALLLIATLGAQYYLNLVVQQENIDLREAQDQALVAGISLAFRSIPSTDRMKSLVADPDQTFLDDDAKQRIRDIIIIDSEWKVTDSLSDEYLPTTNDADEPVYQNLADLTDLPPLMEEARLGDDLTRFPNRRSTGNFTPSDEAHAVPIETSQGRWYVMILRRNDRSEARWRAARPLIYTLGVLLVSSLITFWLVFGVGIGSAGVLLVYQKLLHFVAR